MIKKIFFLILLTISVPQILEAKSNEITTYQYTQIAKTQSKITPQMALDKLKAGNKRFINGKSRSYNFKKIRKVTSQKGQFPYANVLSCMDSRSDPKIVLDQGLGNVFSSSNAGNISDVNMVAGMEFATRAVGSNLVVVMGHTHCGAVQAACVGHAFGNINKLIRKIRPAVKIVKAKRGKLDCDDPNVVNEIAKQNVIQQIRQSLKQSSILSKKVDKKEIQIVGAMHDIKTGKVRFFTMEGKDL